MSSNKVFQAKEMLGGSRDSFDYLECTECGSLSLLEVPSDMSIYYGNSNYGTVVDGTISGTTVTFGDNTVFAAVNAANSPNIVFDSATNKTVIGYTNTAVTGSGTSIVTDFTNALVTSSDYYVQADGTLSTTVSSVPAGRALSSTSILLEG